MPNPTLAIGGDGATHVSGQPVTQTKYLIYCYLIFDGPLRNQEWGI